MPQEKRRSCITPEGARRLAEEIERLWSVERPRVTQEVAAAAALGDRSENAEYVYGKRRLREIDSRVRYLRKRLENLVVVRPGEVADRTRAFFGAWVTLEREDGDTARYRLVGPDEVDVERGCISIESPLGRMLVGRAPGDEVSVRRPAGLAAYTVLGIEYET